MIWLTALLGAALVVTAVLYFVLLRRARVVISGLELLRGEEYNNRLRRVGEPGADRIVNLFNTLMNRLSEERLKLIETNNLLDLLVKASPMGVAILDFDARQVTMSNDAFLSFSEEVARNSSGVVLEMAAEMNEGEVRTLRFGHIESYKLSRLSFMQSGFRRPFILLERLTDEIRKAEREAYGKVVRTISHEVNNTVGGVSSFLESLVDIDVVDADVRELAESCVDSCNGLATFIRGYADVVKIGEPQRVMLDYNEEIRKGYPFLCSILPPGVTLALALDDKGVMIDVDPVMMRQVLVNIVKNAGESGCTRVRISTSSVRTCGEPQNVIEIENDGKSLSREESSRLFTPFFTTKSNGQGLGLTLTADILCKHGCKFSLTTRRSGCTVFQIFFPAVR